MPFNKFINKPKLIRGEYVHFCIWAYFLLVGLFIFYTAYLLPGKGFDLTDHGYYLYSSFAYFLHAEPMDELTALRPGSLFNGFWMLLGFQSYLFMSIAFLALLMTSAGILLLGIHREFGKTAYFPITLSATLAYFYTYIANYQNLPAILVAFAVGFFFFEKRSCKILSALCFVLAGFSNIPLMPVVLVSVILLTLFPYRDMIIAKITPYKKNRALAHQVTPQEKRQLIYFWITFVLFFMTVGSLYIKSVMDVQWINDENRTYVTKVFDSIAPAFQLFIVCCIGGGILRVLALKLKMRPIFSLFLAVIFIKFFPWIFPHVIGRAENIFALSILSVILFYKKNIIGDKIILSCLIALLFFFDQAATTGSAMMFIMYSNIWLVLFSMSIFNANTEAPSLLDKKLTTIVFVAIMLYLISGGLKYHLHNAYRSSPPLEKNMVTLHISPLQGVRVPVNKAQMTTELMTIYSKYHCEDKPFFAFADQPLLYYLFQRVSLTGASWEPGTMLQHIDEKKLVKQLRKEGKWCVFVTQGNRGMEEWQKTLLLLQTMLHDESQEMIEVKATPAMASQSHPELYKIFIR